jgi:hypothetical protein
VLIDLPAALPGAPRWLRRRDLGELDMSLADDLSLADRVRLRAAALSAQRPFSASERAELRAVGRTSHARRQAHLRSRTRRCLRPGRLYAALQVDGARGMRLRECDADRVARALTTPMGDGELSAVHFATGSTWTGGWRRSPAQRAWIAGHGLRARGIGAPRPWAFAEWHRRGRVQRSAVLLDPTRAATPEHTGGAQAWLRAVVELGAALRRDGVDHAGLAAAELRLDPHDALTLTGLEHIRFRRRLPEEACARIDACVAVWLAACAAPPAERAAALKRYVARTRFLPGPPARISRARS